MGNNKLCATCTPINKQNQNQSKYTLTLQADKKDYKLEVKNDLSGLAVIIAFFGLLFLFLTRKKKPSWQNKRYQNQPYVNVSTISDDNGVVGLFGQRFSQTEPKKLCSPPS